MNSYLVAAGVVAAVTFLVHTIGGHFDPLLPMLRTDLEETAKRTMHAGWHVITADLLISSVVLLWAGIAPESFAWLGGVRGVVAYVVLQWVGFLVAFLAVAIGTKQYWRLPQPVLLAPVIVLAALGIT